MAAKTPARPGGTLRSAVRGGLGGAAVDAALVAIQSDSLRESAHEALAAAYLAAGNRLAAHTYRDSYREFLRRELAALPVGAAKNPWLSSHTRFNLAQ